MLQVNLAFLKSHMFRRLTATVVGLLLAMGGAQAQNPVPQVFASPPFEAYLEPLRQQAGIPGLSAAILLDGEIVWERGYGFQNLESRIRATPDTPYYIADLSQSLAAVLLLQCVESRLLELDEPVRSYGLTLPESGVTIRHLLSHTSAGVPGATFRYDLERFSQLTTLVTRCIPQPYRKSVSHRLLEHLAMRDSVPGRDLENPNVVEPGTYDPAHLERYQRVLERMAVPYRVDRRNRTTRTEMPVDGINAATGLVSTVRDLARFDRALDSTLLLESTRALAWTNVTASDFSSLPTGLGWFVQNYRGVRVVWQFGVIPNAYSSLILKVPSRRLTVILLANSDGLSAPFQLHAGDVTRSAFASLFLRLAI
jgi:CubicO group peptidase (beta-lactamase class C family)